MTLPVEVGRLSVDDGSIELTAPGSWREYLRRAEARPVAVSPSLRTQLSLSRQLPRAEMHTAFLMSFGETNDTFDEGKQSFSWWLKLRIDVGRLMSGEPQGPVLNLVLRAADYRGGTDIRLFWPQGAPADAAALTPEVLDRLLIKLAYLVGYRVGYLEAQATLPDWSLRCPETRGRFGCRGGVHFDDAGADTSPKWGGSASE